RRSGSVRARTDDRFDSSAEVFARRGRQGGIGKDAGTIPMADRGEAQGTLLDDALRSTTRAVASAPKVTLLLVLVVSGICVALTICFLGYKTNRADLIDPAATYQKRWLAYTQNFGAGSDIVAV